MKVKYSYLEGMALARNARHVAGPMWTSGLQRMCLPGGRMVMEAKIHFPKWIRETVKGSLETPGHGSSPIPLLKLALWPDK